MRINKKNLEFVERSQFAFLTLLLSCLILFLVICIHKNYQIKYENYGEVSYEQAMLDLTQNEILEVNVYKKNNFILLKYEDSSTAVSMFDNYSNTLLHLSFFSPQGVDIKCDTDASVNSNIIANLSLLLAWIFFISRSLIYLYIGAEFYQYI